MNLTDILREREKEFAEKIDQIIYLNDNNITNADVREMTSLYVISFLAALEGVREVVEGMKKSGIHEFEVGYSKCKHCGEPRIVVDRRSIPIVVDEKSGGSVNEVTVTEYKTEGHPCLKNYSSQHNTALTDILTYLDKEIASIKEV